VKELLEKIRSIKGIGWILAVLITGILLIFLTGRIETTTEEVETGDDFSFSDYESALEKRLENIIEEMEGVSSVQVMVFLDSSYLLDVTERSELVLSEKAPEVRGVAVICKGGDQISVQKKIISLLASLLSIPTNKIYVGN
jgi:stage III sporulation protein AG